MNKLHFVLKGRTITFENKEVAVYSRTLTFVVLLEGKASFLH